MTWRKTTLGALCIEGGGDIQTGPFGSQLHASDYASRGIPVVMPTNIGNNVIDPEGIARVRASDAERLVKYRLRSGDIVYSRRGDVEKCAYVRPQNEGWLCGTGCLRVRFGNPESCDPLFVSYLLATEDVRDWIVRHAVGATMPNLNTSILKALPLRLPENAVQVAIGGVLGALDDKIAANALIACTTRELASLQFKCFSSNEVTLSTVGAIMSLEYGKALPATSRRRGSVEVFGSGGIVGSHDSTWLKGPGVVVGRKGTAGSVHWVHADFYPIDTTFYVVPRRPETPLIYCYHALRELDLKGANSDSAVPGLNRSEAYALRLNVPTGESVEAASDRALTLFELAHNLERESSVLAALRDTLLPQLMSGKLRVKDADKQVEAVA